MSLRSIARVGTGAVQREVRAVADPGVGANYSVGPPGGKYWQVLSFKTLYTPSADALSRWPQLRTLDGDGAVVQSYPFAAAITAAQVETLTWATGLGGTTGANAQGLATALPSPLYLGPGETIVTAGTIHANDAFTVGRLVVLEANTGDVAAAAAGADAMRQHVESIIRFIEDGAQ